MDTTASTTLASPSVSRPRVRGLLVHAVLTAICAVAVLALVGFALARPLGFRVLVDHSDSMAPAIRTGDLLVAKDIPPRQAHVGDVITFHAPDGGRLTTHRVVRRRLNPGARWTFTTRGDANTAGERWDVPADGRVGRVTVRLPRAGYALGWLGRPLWAVVLVAGGGLLLAALLARRIWQL